MPLQPKALESPIHHYGPSSFHSSYRQNPSPIFPFNRPLPVFACKGVEIAAPKLFSTPIASVNCAATHDWKLRGAGIKDNDVATLGNLCVDIVLSVPRLPPPAVEERKALMERLSASPPDKVPSSFSNPPWDLSLILFYRTVVCLVVQQAIWRSTLSSWVYII